MIMIISGQKKLRTADRETQTNNGMTLSWANKMSVKQQTDKRKHSMFRDGDN